MLYAQSESADDPSPILPAAPALNEERIMGVIPNYQTVNDPHRRFRPLTPGQKVELAWRSTIDPFNLASAAIGAGLSQAGNETPKYGNGAGAYNQRLAAAFLDFGTQNFFSAALMANVLHQDPRYYRRGPEYGFLSRVLYSASRVLITKDDSGKNTFNTSGLTGMAMGIATSNLYYPSASRTGSVMAGRVYTSLTGGVIGNLMAEFWPDIQSHLFHRHH